MSWEAILIAVAALVWLTALDKIRTGGIWPAEPAERANLLALVALALILTISVPQVYVGIDRAAGVPNLALLLTQGLAVVGLWLFQPLVRQARGLARDYARKYGVSGLLTEPTRARRIFASGWVMAGVLIALGLLFGLAPVHGETLPDYSDFMARYADAPYMLAYTTVFAAYVGGMVGELFLLAARNSRHLPTRALRLRGYLQAVGWANYLVYLGHEVLATLARQWGLADPADGARAARHALLAGGVLLLMSGGFIDLYIWGRRWVEYRQLHALWRALWQADPAVMRDGAFPPLPRALRDALAIRRFEERRFRRMIKIRDGIVAMRPYADAAVIARARALCHAAGLDEEATAAVVEAAAVRSALHARSRGELPPRQAQQPVADPPSGDSMASLDQLLAREADRLVAVARAFDHSPIVVAALFGTASVRPSRGRSRSAPS